MNAAAGWLAAAAVTLALPVPQVALVRLPRTGASPAGSMRPRPVAAGLGAVLCVTAGVLRGPLVAAALLMTAGSAGFAIRVALGRRAQDRTDSALLAATRLMRAELTAGSLEPDAMAAAADVAGESAAALRVAARRAADGDLAAVVAELATHPPTRPLAAAWQVRSRLGVPLGAALSQVERGVQDRLALRRTIGELLAGPRASATVLAVLPVVGLLLGMQMGADPIAFLTESPAGRLVLLAGAALDAAGLCWSVALASRAERLR